MAYWVTFSNGHEACQTYPAKKLAAKAKEIGFPHVKYSWGESMDFGAASEKQKIAWASVRDAVLDEEAKEYIDKMYPGEGISVVKMQSLPYGGRPYFGSGSADGHFCFTPKACAGRGGCPRRRACSE